MSEAWQWALDHGVLMLPYVYWTVDVALRLVSLIVVPRNRRPGSAIAWLLAIMVLPLVGFPLYLMLGKAQLPRARREKQRVINRLMRVRAQNIPDRELDPDVPSWMQTAVRLNRAIGARVAIPCRGQPARPVRPLRRCRPGRLARRAATRVACARHEAADHLADRALPQPCLLVPAAPQQAQRGVRRHRPRFDCQPQ